MEGRERKRTGRRLRNWEEEHKWKYVIERD